MIASHMVRAGSLAARSSVLAPVVLMAASADAAIVSWPNLNINCPSTVLVHIDFFMGGPTIPSLSTFAVSGSATSLAFVPMSDGGGMMRFPGMTTGGAGSLQVGNVVGASGSFSLFETNVSFGSGNGQWKLNATNYFGVRFMNANLDVFYGYGTMAVGASAGTRRITSLFYEDSGGSITVVPAPAAIALLGFVPLVGRRRR